MNINQILGQALAALKRPIFPSVYDSKIDNAQVPFFENKAKGYFIFNYISERGEIYGDNEEIAENTSIQLHYYTKTANTLIQETKSALLGADFCIEEIKRLFEQDTGYNHIVYQLEYLTFNPETEE